MNDSERGTGRTTAQLKSAPRIAIFVWCNERTEYPRDLCMSLMRLDISVYGPSWLDHQKSRRGYAVIVDHAARLTEQQQRTLDIYRSEDGMS